MPTQQEIDSELQQIYESASLRDDINDDEADVLLKWGERQIERMARLFPEEFEQKCRFMRQLIKNINRFVGQREFNELDGQKKYMEKVMLYLPQVGFDGITEDMLFAHLPAEKTDMMGTLRAVLNTLTPPAVSTPDGQDTLIAGLVGEVVPPSSAPTTSPVDNPVEAHNPSIPDEPLTPPSDIPPVNPEPNTSENNPISNLFGMLNNLGHHPQNPEPTNEPIEENNPHDEKE